MRKKKTQATKNSRSNPRDVVKLSPRVSADLESNGSRMEQEDEGIQEQGGRGGGVLGLEDTMKMCLER